MSTRNLAQARRRPSAGRQPASHARDSEGRAAPQPRVALGTPGAQRLLFDVVGLQRLVGNQATGRLLGAAAPSEPVQRAFMFDNQQFDETTMPAQAMEELWHRMRTGNTSQIGDKLTRVEYAYFSRFGKTIKAGRDARQPSSSQAPITLPATAEKYVPGKVKNAEEVLEIQAALNDWLVYAQAKQATLKNMLRELIDKRKQLGEQAFHDATNADFKKLFKRLNSDVQHLNSTGFVCNQLLNYSLAPNDDNVRYIRRAGKVAAVILWHHGAKMIEDLAADPRNLVPEGEQLDIAKGVAKALIGLTILVNRKEGESNIALNPATNKVKGIYDNYGFRVVKSGQEIPRPPKGRHVSKAMLNEQELELGEKYKKAEGNEQEQEQIIEQLQKVEWRRRPDMAWHAEMGGMRMTPTRASEFMAKEKPEEVLALPDELKPYLKEATNKT